MSQPVRTRFAPSPTGDLHLGNLRIAVFNHLFARRHGGAFIIRIEDTDVERNRPAAIERILEDLRWAKLDWDEGPDRDGPFGPYVQSAREPRHRERALELLERGLAYLCFCSQEEIAAERGGRDTSMPPGCPGGCRDLPREVGEERREKGEVAAIRFAVPDQDITISDEIRGDISFHGRSFGDFVILRADRRPTYNFAVAADDVDMRISHVIRGSGHLSNTPKQAVLFDALGAPRPVFAHLPTVLGPDGSKLSKRTGAPGVDLLRNQGYHPDAVVNYLSLLGWSPGDDREVLSRPELIDEIDFGRAGASNTAYDPEKLRWLSAQHIQGMPTPALVAAVTPHLDRARFSLDDRALHLGVEAVRTRLRTFGEVNDHLGLVFADEEALEAARGELEAEGEEARRVVAAVRDAFVDLDNGDAESLGAAVRQVGKNLGIKGAGLFHPVRLAVSASRSGPDLGKVLAALGRERAVHLLDRALD